MKLSIGFNWINRSINWRGLDFTLIIYINRVSQQHPTLLSERRCRLLFEMDDEWSEVSPSLYRRSEPMGLSRPQQVRSRCVLVTADPRTILTFQRPGWGLDTLFLETLRHKMSELFEGPLKIRVSPNSSCRETLVSIRTSVGVTHSFRKLFPVPQLKNDRLIRICSGNKGLPSLWTESIDYSNYSRGLLYGFSGNVKYFLHLHIVT